MLTRLALCLPTREAWRSLARALQPASFDCLFVEVELEARSNEAK